MTLSRILLFVVCFFGGLGFRLCEGQSIAAADRAPDTLVVCSPEFQPALQEWLEYRRRQGHEIAVVSPAPSPAEIKAQIRHVATCGQLKSVFLVGDVGEAQADASRLVPTCYVPAKVNVLFGSEPEIASDNPYADLDDDGIPDLAIGRLTADTASEVRSYITRVIQYETNHSPEQTWRRNVNFVAGVGGFGGVVDSVLEQTTKQIITDLVPQHYQTSMTFGSWRSPFCPDPRRFSETAIRRFNEGCMFWIYIGHGQPTGLDQVHLPDQSHTILDGESVGQVCCQSGNPIAIFLSCYTGAADHHTDCLAEELMRRPCGPIGAICGSRVTMPYAMSLLSLEMVNEFFDGTSETLGELMQVSKRKMVKQAPVDTEEDGSSVYRNMIQGMGRLLSPRPDLLTSERLEHAQLIHLFGDPLLRLKRPAKIEVSSECVAESGNTLAVTGVSPFAGEMTVELVYRRDRFRTRPPHRKDYVSTDAAFQTYQHVYESSHDLTCDQQRIAIEEGSFEIDLNIPESAIGPCVIRCMVSSPEAFALGSSPIEIRNQNSTRQAKR